MEVNSATLFYCEILDENDTVLPWKRRKITSLYNKAHPFIRYDIGDLGILEKSTQ
jgi:phenylacetate-CoA ligase